MMERSLLEDERFLRGESSKSIYVYIFRSGCTRIECFADGIAFSVLFLYNSNLSQRGKQD